MFNNNLNLYKNITVIILFLPSYYNNKNKRARMSSLFNSKNNRFDILNSDDNTNKERNKNKEKNRDKSNVKKQEQEQKKEEPRNFNSFKNDSQPFYEDRRNNRRFNERRSVNSKEMEERNKELEKNKKEKEREEALKETNFPDLIQNNPNKTNKKTDKTQNQESNQQQPQPIINFLEKVKNNLTKDERLESKNIIKPGWVCMEKARNSNQIIYTYGKQTYFPREPVPIDVLNALVKLHEKQVIQYDYLWGEGAYDEHYKSPYYDYEYFDRLDEQYEDEMERQEQEDRVKERDYDDYYTY